MLKQNCYECVHRRNLPGDRHSRCNNVKAHVEGNAHGRRNGWFRWPFNFDPAWLVSCDGFSSDKADNSESTPSHGDAFVEFVDE